MAPKFCTKNALFYEIDARSDEFWISNPRLNLRTKLEFDWIWQSYLTLMKFKCYIWSKISLFGADMTVFGAKMKLFVLKKMLQMKVSYLMLKNLKFECQIWSNSKIKFKILNAKKRNSNEFVWPYCMSSFFLK